MAVVEVRTEDGLSLIGWHRAAAPGRRTLVYFHGNAGNIGDRGGKIRPYLDAGMGVLLAVCIAVAAPMPLPPPVITAV